MPVPLSGLGLVPEWLGLAQVRLSASVSDLWMLVVSPENKRQVRGLPLIRFLPKNYDSYFDSFPFLCEGASNDYFSLYSFHSVTPVSRAHLVWLARARIAPRIAGRTWLDRIGCPETLTNGVHYFPWLLGVANKVHTDWIMV